MRAAIAQLVGQQAWRSIARCERLRAWRLCAAIKRGNNLSRYQLDRHSEIICSQGDL
jgi:hypothetical protein